MANDPIYRERYRPQFHFSARQNWLNDPNGCVYYAGEYHLFFQHNPSGAEWGNMTWGHAVSPDLVHWTELPCALFPYGGGDIFSGSAVVDWRNTSGLGEAGKPPLAAFFTHARPPCGQALASSNDRGRTWKRYRSGEHVIPNLGLDAYERDPKVFWHQPSAQWVMALWVQMNTVWFFNSADLIHWRHTGDFVGEGFWECPDLFELPVDGDVHHRKWVLHDANFTYWIGSFDGQTFSPESVPLCGDFGANFYAAQTWNNTDERVIQIAWMRGGQYPGMHFNQQMSFPCELSLRQTPNGLRLCRQPVPELASLYIETGEISNKMLLPGENLLPGLEGDLLDIELEVDLQPEASFSLRVYDQMITWSSGTISCLGKAAPLALIDGAIKVRLLVDRTSLELFGNQGELSMSGCFLPGRALASAGFCTGSQPVLIRSLVLHKLRSAWE